MPTNSNQINSKAYKAFVADSDGVPIGLTALDVGNVSNVPAANIVGAIVNAQFSGTSNLGSNANVKITGGANGQALVTDGTGNLRWSSVTGSAGGNVLSVQFNDNGVLNGIATTSFNGVSLLLGSNSTLRITGGSNGQALITDGAGNLSWANVPVGIANTIAGGNSNVRVFANSNVTTSVANVANVFVVTSTGVNVAGTLNATGAATVGGALFVTGNANITGALNVSNNVSITGNLTVSGTTNYINTTSLVVQDRIIEEGGGPNGAPLTVDDGKDRGIAMNYYTTQPVKAFMGWDDSAGEFGFGSNVAIANDVVSWTTYGNVRANTFIGNGSLTNLTVTGNSNFAAVNISGNATLNRLTVNTVSTLGSNANVRISGGTSGQVLRTDGTGNLYWAESVTGATGGVEQALLQFTGSAAGGNGQTFVDPGIATFISNVYALVFVNGVQQRTANYTIVGTALTMNVNLASSARVTVGSMGSFTGSTIGRDTIANALSNVAVTLNGNVNTSVAGVPNVFVVTANGAQLSGNLRATGGANIGGGLIVDGNAVINGNINITGNLNYVNSTATQVQSPIIEIGGTSLTSNDGWDRGTLLHYYTTQPVDAFIGWDNSGSEFIMGSNVSVAANVVSVNTYGNVRGGTFIGNGSFTNAVVTGTANLANIVSNGTANLTTVNVGGVSNLGPIGNVKITGGVANATVLTDGAGNLRYYSPPTIKMPSVSLGYGRMHAYGTQIWRSGGGTFGQIVTQELGTYILNSIQLYTADGATRNWVKHAYWNYNWYGLDDQGILWTAGDATNGLLGNGLTTGYRTVITIANSPKLYGAGITVLDFWLSEIIQDNWNTAGSASCFVHVNDNGLLKTYSFGFNQNGSLGNGTTNAISDPFLITQLNGKSVVDACIGKAIAMLVTSTGELWGSGWNPDGVLGLGNTTNPISTFTRATNSNTTLVSNAAKVVISWNNGGGVASYVLTTSGGVIASGYGANGRLGNGGTASINRFTPVLTAAATPITNIVKIIATQGGVAMLDSSGQVWFSGINVSGSWGNGQAAGTTNAGNFAAIKQTGVANMWGCPTGLHPNLTTMWYLDLTPQANGYRKLWGAGLNTVYALGVIATGDNVNCITKEWVPLPPEEYPVDVRMIGSMPNDVSSYYNGAMLLTNKNKLYVVGRFASAAVNGLNTGSVVRYFHCLSDFYNINPEI